MKLHTTFLSAFTLAAAFALAAPSLRAEEAAGGAAPATAPAPAVEKAKHARMKGEKATGAIEKVDAAAKSITIGGKTYKVADSAKVSIDGAPKTLADLQVGDSVTVKYSAEADGSLVAQGLRKGEAAKGAKAGGHKK